ncbi:dihydroorotase [Paenibacillus sinopodophylli]|uniref:dihydroorotase n=1 Tax=Paenibacillus sinopodophylli TaxID=1837342 RepID=UPI00110CC51E|nr:dihydroorotase [Paenibacillus sinopodophylli]
MFYDLIVRGNLVLEDKVVYGEVGIKDEAIHRITESRTLRGARTLDFEECFVFPGMIDAHVHCFSNPLEGFVTTSSSAAAGGITTLLDMPYDLPAPISSAELFKRKVDRLKREAIVDIGLWATIAKTEGTEQIIPLAEAGAMAFKLSTFETDPFRFPEIPDHEIIKAMELIRDTGLRVAFHAENNELIKSLTKQYISAGRLYPRAHMETRPPVTETSAVLKVLEFAYWTGVKVHIVHVSHPRTIQLIQWYKEGQVDVTSETCYPYLLMNVSALEKFGPVAKNNPPLRLAADAAKLWELQRQGSIDIITSDHAPWGADRKEAGEHNIFLAAAGVPGVEIMIPLMFDHAVMQEGVPPEVFAKWMSQYPAEVFGIPRKGKISPGYDADFTVIDPLQSWTIDQTKLRSHSKLSPFHGHEVQGKIKHTIVRGKSVYDGNQIVAQPGSGQFIAGSAYKREVVSS